MNQKEFEEQLDEDIEEGRFQIYLTKGTTDLMILDSD